jgi:O-antigen/teichoic acid export membrane protein
VLTRLRTDNLVRNSLYLMLNFTIQGVLGFAFWVVIARIYSTTDVGIASSLISATALIAYFALLGLNSTLVRYLPTARQSGALISGALLLVGGCAALIGLVYVLLTPVLAPRLAFVEGHLALAVGFVLLAATTAINLLTDAVFIARRKAGLCVVTDGAIGGLSKIFLGILFAGTGAYGLFSASAGGFAVAAIASIVAMLAVLQWRPSFREPFRALRPLLKFSGANYVANAMSLLPSIAVPLIILDRLGARPAAYYYIAYQMGNLLFAAVYSVEQAFLAEGSQANADWREVRRRSWRFGIVLFLPASVMVVVASHWILLAFGPAYSRYGSGSLKLLALAVIPIAICNWSWTVLRLLNRLRALVMCTTVWAMLVCGLAWVLAPHGLTVLTVAWPVGCSIGAVLSLVASARKIQARHRRTTPRQPATRAT